MSLRKSPRRTPALLASNRRNALKSTGPRTPSGKHRMVLNALKHGLRSRDLAASLEKLGQGADELESLRRALALAFLPETKRQWKQVFGMADDVWVSKRAAERWAASPERLEDCAAESQGALPAPHRIYKETPPRNAPAAVAPMPALEPVRSASNGPERSEGAQGKLREGSSSAAPGNKPPSRGWKVAVTVCFRRGRGPTGRRVVRPGYGWEEGQGKPHAAVRLACTGHPVLDSGSWPVLIPTKPECARKRKGCADVSAITESVERMTGLAELRLAAAGVADLQQSRNVKETKRVIRMYPPSQNTFSGSPVWPSCTSNGAAEG